MTGHILLLRAASLLISRRERAEWLAEWENELWYVGDQARLRFCWGAWTDAWLLPGPGPAARLREALEFPHPLGCLAFLGGLAAAGMIASIGVPDGNSLLLRHAAYGTSFIAALALLIFPSTTPLRLGDYSSSASLSRTIPPRRWLFVFAKGLMLFLILYGQVRLLGDPRLSILDANIRIHVLLWGTVAALRWMVRDQRQRCPVCLRKLDCPVQMGRPARYFLEWRGVEYICTRGHGLLHVPDTPDGWSETQSWTYLDPSWRDLG